MSSQPQTMRLARASRQQGFTLVELIVVIVILGILSAVAVPRFIDIQSNARAAKAQGILGSVRAAAALGKSAAMVAGHSCSAPAPGNVLMEGASIAIRFCYPTTAQTSSPLPTTDIITAANLNATTDGLTITYPGSAHGLIDIGITGATTIANCAVRYTPAAAANAQPTITIDTSAC